jgi:anti-sigma B factor antagonist
MTNYSPVYDDDPIAFEIIREPDVSPPCLRLNGEMDLRAATDLREALLNALTEGSGTILLDLEKLTFIDSTIISVLIMARKRADSANGEVRLRNLPSRIQRILSITGIESLFPIEPGSGAGDGGGGGGGDRGSSGGVG